MNLPDTFLPEEKHGGGTRSSGFAPILRDGAAHPCRGPRLTMCVWEGSPPRVWPLPATQLSFRDRGIPEAVSDFWVCVQGLFPSKGAAAVPRFPKQNLGPPDPKKSEFQRNILRVLCQLESLGM